MKLHITLKTKIVIGVIFATVVLSVFVSVIASRLIQTAIADLGVKYLDAVIVQQSETVNTVFENSISFARRLASQQTVIDYLQKPNAPAQDPALLKQFVNFDIGDQYQSIYVMDRTGLTLTSTDPSFVGQNYGFRDYFKKALSGAPAVDAAIGVTSGKFGYFFAHPVIAGDGRIVGVMVVKLKTQKLEGVLRPQPLSKDGKSMLVDEYGVIIQSDQPGLLYKSLGTLSEEVKRKFIETKRFNTIDVQPMQYGIIQQELRAMRGAKSYTIYDEVDKRDEIIGVARVSSLPFFIVIEESAKSFGDIAHNIGLLIMITIGAAGLMGILMIWLLLVRLLRPLGALKNAMVNVSGGDLNQSVPIATDDELGALGTAFNLMTVDLKNFHGDLEGKVWERTADYEKYKMAVEGASDHIVITDIDGRILYANRAAVDITGYSLEEMIGNRPTVWGRQMPRAFYEKMWHIIKEEKKPFYGEVLNRRKSGERYTAEIHIAPLFMNKDVLYGFVTIEQDVTAHREIDRAKTEFTSIASHQLRTPLSIVNWYVEMLMSEETGKINESQRKYLDQIYLASKRMVDVVNSLLSVSRIDLKAYHIETKPVDFHTIADSVLKEFKTLIEKKQLNITKTYDSQMPLIDADPSLLLVIFQNLLSNAIKYTPDGGSVQIAIGKSEDGQALISVTDTGYGIPLQQQSRIFQKFFRADNARAKEPDGNGLGLYIVKSIIENTDGAIWFTSTEEKGTTFYVKFPLTGMKQKEVIKPSGL